MATQQFFSRIATRKCSMSEATIKAGSSGDKVVPFILKDFVAIDRLARDVAFVVVEVGVGPILSEPIPCSGLIAGHRPVAVGVVAVTFEGDVAGVFNEGQLSAGNHRDSSSLVYSARGRLRLLYNKLGHSNVCYIHRITRVDWMLLHENDCTQSVDYLDRRS